MLDLLPTQRESLSTVVLDRLGESRLGRLAGLMDECSRVYHAALTRAVVAYTAGLSVF